MRPKTPAHRRGEHCEHLALKHFESQGYQLLKQRWRHPLAEIDLCFLHPEQGHYLLAEVKSLRNWDWFYLLWTKKQKRRFFRVAQSLAQSRQVEVRLAFVVVDSRDKVHVFDDWDPSARL